MKKFSKCVGKMRMSLMMFAAVLCCAMAASVFTACSSSDDDNKDSDSGSKVGGVMVYVGFTESEDVLKYCDVSVVYNDGTGEKTETITKTDWSKKLTVTKLPATITFKKTTVLKAGVDVSSISTFKYSTVYSSGYCQTNAEGTAITTLSATSFGGTKTIAGSKVTEALNSGSLNKTVAFTFDANGNLQ